MNLKRIFVIFIAVFLLAVVSCGAAAAFAVEKEAVINPYTSLSPGDKVTAAMEIKLPKGAADSGSRISFDTPLAGGTWVVDIIKGGTVVNTRHPASPCLFISGFDLDYDTAVTLRISVSGTVSSESLGQEISVLQITASDMHDLGIQSYSSPKQKVNSAAEPRTAITPQPAQKDGQDTSNVNRVFLVTKDAVISPAESLVPGDEVTAVMEIKLPKGTVDTAGKISFDSPLAGDTWVVDIIRGGIVVNTKHPASPYNYISGWDLDYETDITLRIAVSGTVSSDSSEKEISVLQVAASDMNGGSQSYTSPKQYVYDPSRLNGELTALGNTITALDTGIASCLANGCNVEMAKTYVGQARSKYNAAVNAGFADTAAAFAEIETGNEFARKAQTELDRLIAEIESRTNEIISVPESANNLITTPEPAQTEIEDISNEFKKIIRKLIAWLESLIS